MVYYFASLFSIKSIGEEILILWEFRLQLYGFFFIFSSYSRAFLRIKRDKSAHNLSNVLLER
ncbi:hypothetical protein CW304_28935 [Bacillus sp. UFRGS-B20]|nr:hypothetical protein CW304_28935 [Bacillus sp. UFRGS-B20]